MTQTLWQKKPKRMRITVDGTHGPGHRREGHRAARSSRKIGADGAQGHAVEYAGSAIRALSMEGRLTLCNLSIEAGARCGMIAPGRDDVRLPRGAAVRAARARRSSAPSPTGARSPATRTPRSTARSRSTRRDRADRDVGHQPRGRAADRRPRARSGAVADRGTARRDAGRARLYGPRARAEADRDSRSTASSSAPAPTAASRICAPPPRVLRAARRGRAGPGLAGLEPVKRQAEAEGLDRIFTAAGLDWARARMLDVRRHERRHRAAGRALRLDHQPQLQRPPGAGRAHASDVARDGGGGGGHRPSRRCAPDAARERRDGAVHVSSMASPVRCALANVDTDQ